MIALQRMFGKLLSPPRLDTGITTLENVTASELLRLPPEIIILIASKLPTLSTACFSLCNHHLNHILGTGSWRSLQTEGHDLRLQFLSFLGNDLPEYFLCQYCVRLHRMDIFKWARQAKFYFGPGCMKHGKGLRNLSRSSYTIFSPHIQLAMKQHYCDTDIGFPLEAFKHLEVEHDKINQKVTLLSVDAQIISDELLIRSQTWILLPWSQCDKYMKELDTYDASNLICVHTRIVCLNRSVLLDLVRSKIDQLRTQEKCSTQVSRCSYCWLDYVLDAVDFGERGFALRITRWANLGAALDIGDAKWQSHIDVIKTSISYIKGAIRTSFESQASKSVEDMTTDSELKLFSKRQIGPYRRGSDGLKWRLDEGNMWYLPP